MNGAARPSARRRSPGAGLGLLVLLLAGAVTAVVLLVRVLLPASPEQGARPGPEGRAVVLQTGVEVFSLWRDWPVNTTALQQVADSGSGWVRIGVGWCSLEERGPGQVSTWYQDRLDSTVEQALRLGLKPLATLGCTPTWLSGSQDLKALPRGEEQYRHYQRIATYLAQRYRGRIAAWEVWNEPDCSGGTCPNTPASDYVPVLRAGYAGIKAADPSATVISAGTSGANAQWIQGLYAAGAKGFFDALGLHPYQGPAAEPPEAPPAEHPYRITNVAKVREVMLSHGDGAKSIWFTEFGWTTGAGSGWSAGVDEATQADYLRRALRMVQNWYPYVSHAFVFTIRDRDDWNAYENGFGLTRLDGSAKPALEALRSTNTWLHGMHS